MPDNTQLSNLNFMLPEQGRNYALDQKVELDERVADFVASSIAENTQRAYQSDLAHFWAWGGRIPAAPAAIHRADRERARR